MPRLFLLCLLAVPAAAHQGPPFPIIVDRKLGPCVISVWTDPDIGIGTFFVMTDPLPGGSVPSDLKVELGVEPVNHRLPEVVYPTEREERRGQIQYNARVEFDRQEFWNIRVRLQSSAGNAEATAQVEATPPGLGRWDLLFYLLPFLALPAVWFLGVRRRKRALKTAAAKK